MSRAGFTPPLGMAPATGLTADFRGWLRGSRGELRGSRGEPRPTGAVTCVGRLAACGFAGRCQALAARGGVRIGGPTAGDPGARAVQLDLIFAPTARAALETRYCIIPVAAGEVASLPAEVPGEARHILGQPPLDAATLARMGPLRCIFNVVSNLLPNLPYEGLFQRGIRQVTTGAALAGGPFVGASGGGAAGGVPPDERDGAGGHGPDRPGIAAADVQAGRARNRGADAVAPGDGELTAGNGDLTPGR
jgi:hypothetical protein